MLCLLFFEKTKSPKHNEAHLVYEKFFVSFPLIQWLQSKQHVGLIFPSPLHTSNSWKISEVYCPQDSEVCSVSARTCRQQGLTDWLIHLKVLHVITYRIVENLSPTVHNFPTICYAFFIWKCFVVDFSFILHHYKCRMRVTKHLPVLIMVTD